MAKQEIGWKKELEDGTRRQVKVRLVGGDWQFYERDKRYEQWEYIEYPPLEDMLELLGGVERRMARKLFPPEKVEKLRKLIKARYPQAKC